MWYRTVICGKVQYSKVNLIHYSVENKVYHSTVSKVTVNQSTVQLSKVQSSPITVQSSTIGCTVCH